MGPHSLVVEGWVSFENLEGIPDLLSSRNEGRGVVRIDTSCYGKCAQVEGGNT